MSAGAVRPHEVALQGAGAETEESRRYPPVAEVAVASIILMLAGGILMAARLPKPPNLTVPSILVALGGLLTLGDLVVLSRLRPFAWGTFWLVLKWALLAYVVISGLLLYVFAINHTTGATLGVLIATLVVFAIDVPVILAFTVARYTGPVTWGKGRAASH